MIQSPWIHAGSAERRVPLPEMGRPAANHPLTAPLPFAAMVACVIATFLALDHFATADEQLLLGAATWGILIASCAFLDREDRARALLVVLVATCAEVLGSIVLGAYTYRLENLPAFVPPGHGLVFLAGLRISQSAPVRRHTRAFLWAVIGLVAAWGVAGLVLLGRTDVLGAITGALLICVLLRGRAATLYAGVFLMVGFLEIYGTSIGAWHWAATTPGTPASRRQSAERNRRCLRPLRRRGDRAGAAGAGGIRRSAPHAAAGQVRERLLIRHRCRRRAQSHPR